MGKVGGEYFYLAVTADDLELPIFVSDSPTEIAKKFGIKTQTVIGSAQRKRDGSKSKNKIKFVRVEKEWTD